MYDILINFHKVNIVVYPVPRLRIKDNRTQETPLGPLPVTTSSTNRYYSPGFQLHRFILLVFKLGINGVLPMYSFVSGLSSL